MKNNAVERYYTVPEDTFLKDHEVRELVNDLREAYLVHGQTGHLREVISRIVKKHVNRVSLNTVRKANE